MTLTPRLVPLALAGVVAAGAVAGCGNSSKAKNAEAAPRTASTTAAAPSASGANALSVDLSEWKVASSAASAKAGSVTFTVHNTGKTVHEMIVVPTTKTADKLGTGARVSEAGSAGEASSIAAGATKTVTLKLTAGHYALICNLPGHYMQGMHADLTVN